MNSFYHIFWSQLLHLYVNCVDTNLKSIAVLTTTNQPAFVLTYPFKAIKNVKLNETRPNILQNAGDLPDVELELNRTISTNINAISKNASTPTILIDLKKFKESLTFQVKNYTFYNATQTTSQIVQFNPLLSIGK